jgi:putative ABC transport system permease protein
VFERYKYILNIAIEAVFINKFRSMLTTLGIIFGVAAVIAMMAIGKGAQKEILDQMKLVGVNNILILPRTEKSKSQSQSDQSSSSSSSTSSSSSSSSDQQSTEDKGKGKFSPGLTMKDAEAIRTFIPTVNVVSPEVDYETDIIKDGKQSTARLTGVTPDFFRIFNLELLEGDMFNEEQLREGKAVCIIGQSLKSRFFPTEDPIGKDIKCGNIWLQVIGVLKKREINQTTVEDLGLSDYNNSIYAPIQTVLLRYKDRSQFTSTDNARNIMIIGGSVMITSAGAGAESGNQLDKIVVQVKESSQIKPTTQILKRMMKRRHADVDDVEIRVPELLLKQEQHTKDIFNIVLGAIASISLIVGGIGIMNIMLASVLERIKEIGIRQAMGARKSDIILQFLTEATLISITGGLIGIVLGIVLSKIIMRITGILTIVSPLSILISFGVSATVGIIFGYMPAKRASEQNPVSSLRYE